MDENFGIMDAPQSSAPTAVPYRNLTEYLGICEPTLGAIPTWDGCNWSYTEYDGMTCEDIQDCVSCAFLDTLLISSNGSLNISNCSISIDGVIMNTLVNASFISPNLTVGNSTVNLSAILEGFYFNLTSGGLVQTIDYGERLTVRAFDGIRTILSGNTLSVGLPQEGPFLPPADYYPYTYVLTWTGNCSGALWKLDPCCEQTLSVSGSVLCIGGGSCSSANFEVEGCGSCSTSPSSCTTGGNGSCVDLSIFDNQQLSIVGNILSLENSVDIDLSNVNNHSLELNCFVLQFFNSQDMLLSNILLPHRKRSHSDCDFCQTVFPIWDCCDVIRAMAPTVNQLYFELGELWKRIEGNVPVYIEEHCICDGPACIDEIRRGGIPTDAGSITNYIKNQGDVTNIINGGNITGGPTIIGYNCCTEPLKFNVEDRLACQQFRGQRWVNGRAGDPLFARGLPCIPIAGKAVTGMVDDPDNVSWFGTIGGCATFPDQQETWTDADRGFKGFLPTNDSTGPYSINGPLCAKGPDGSLRIPENSIYHVYMNMQFHVNYLVHAFRAVIYVEDPNDPTVKKTIIDKKIGGDVGTASRSLNNGYYKEEREWSIVGSTDVPLKKEWLLKFAIKIDANVCRPICTYSTTPNETTPGSGVIDWTDHTRDYSLGYGPGTNNSVLPIFNGEGCASPTFNVVGNGFGTISVASTALSASASCTDGGCTITITPSSHTHTATLTSLILPTIPPHAPYYWNQNSNPAALGTSNLRYPGNFLTEDIALVPQWENFPNGLSENFTLFPGGTPLITVFDYGQKTGVPCDDFVTVFDGWTGSSFGFHSIKCVQDSETYNG